ncbi:hypothetical protein SAMN02745215_04089 [Desulfitobacterium chlororespirans DSM 11544]|uniref:Uncharacterized protein n=1 Tax=Desulfitobacterium chlororespirans DSM 11544 TaxID=1121395 RepID=A0A1M7ULM9_9FIRM|nr:hypothetical protein SAMN02745215_04089 [Desulfitobacterium chlororespirans DSM 11544]
MKEYNYFRVTSNGPIATMTLSRSEKMNIEIHDQQSPQSPACLHPFSGDECRCGRRRQWGLLWLGI